MFFVPPFCFALFCFFIPPPYSCFSFSFFCVIVFLYFFTIWLDFISACVHFFSDHLSFCFLLFAILVLLFYKFSQYVSVLFFFIVSLLFLFPSWVLFCSCLCLHLVFISLAIDCSCFDFIFRDLFWFCFLWFCFFRLLSLGSLWFASGLVFSSFVLTGSLTGACVKNSFRQKIRKVGQLQIKTKSKSAAKTQEHGSEW